jgi:hypothetical protein
VSDDALFRFIGAYRAENPGTALDSVAIRRRTLARLAARQRRKLAVLRLLLPVAAAFLGSVALAATRGGVPRFEDVREWLGVPLAAPVNAATAEHRVAPSPRVESESPVRPAPSGRREPPIAVQEPVPVVPGRAPVAEARPRRVEARAARAPVETRRELTPGELRRESTTREVHRATAPKAETLHPSQADPNEARRRALSADLSDYQRAHSLHFHGGDPAIALNAWNVYLAEHPSGTFAPEARFNRAVCLLRLGRRTEARGILVPIAGSAFGYGRDRARAILTAME